MITDCSALWPVLKERSEAMGMALIHHAYMILPPLVMYIGQGPSSLRIWTATQHLTDPESKASKPARSARPLVWALMNFVFFTFSASWLRPDRSIYGTIWAALFFVNAWPFVSLLLISNLGFHEVAVVRDALGFPKRFPAPGKTCLARRFAMFSIGYSLTITFFAFMFDNLMYRMLVYLVALDAIAQMRSNRIQSIRKLLIANFVYIAVIMVLTVSFVFVFKSKAEHDDDGASPGSDQGSNNESGFLDEFAQATVELSNWWQSVLLASFPQTLVAICYRFDHANSLSSNPTEVKTEALAEVKITLPSGEVCSGVLLPEPLSRKFSKPYYLTALAAWCAGNTVLLYLVAAGIFRIQDGDTAYGIVGATVAMPVMTLAVIGVAVMRGELKKMWTYKEEWGLPETPNKPDLAEGSVVEAETLLDEVKEEADEKV